MGGLINSKHGILFTLLKALLVSLSIFFGDFNEILNSVEKMGGVARNKKLSKLFVIV